MRRTPAFPEALSSQVVCVYARFSNDQLQRDASIEDQVRTCTDAATANGWSVEPSLIISDAGVSGAQMSTRECIQTLLHRIQSDRTRTFQGVFRRLVQIRPQPFGGAELLQSLRVPSSHFVLRKPGTRLARPEFLPTDDSVRLWG